MWPVCSLSIPQGLYQLWCSHFQKDQEHQKVVESPLFLQGCSCWWQLVWQAPPLHVIHRSCMFENIDCTTCRRQSVLQSHFDRVSSWTVTFLTHALLIWLRNLGYTWFSVHCLVHGSNILKKFKIIVCR